MARVSPRIPDLINITEYRSLLRLIEDWQILRADLRLPASLRWLEREAKLERRALRMLMEERTPLKSEETTRLATAMGFSGEDVIFFRLLARFTLSRDVEVQRRALLKAVAILERRADATGEGPAFRARLYSWYFSIQVLADRPALQGGARQRVSPGAPQGIAGVARVAPGGLGAFVGGGGCAGRGAMWRRLVQGARAGTSRRCAPTGSRSGDRHRARTVHPGDPGASGAAGPAACAPQEGPTAKTAGCLTFSRGLTITGLLWVLPATACRAAPIYGVQMHRALHALPLAVLFAASTASGGGVIINVTPTKLHVGTGVPRLSAQVMAIRWTSRSGRSATQTLPHPTPASALPPLAPPPGEWTDVALLFDGPVLLTGTDDGAPFTAALDLTALEVPLDQPVVGGSVVHLALDLALPAHLGLPSELTSDAEATLRLALQDGARVAVRP